MTGCRALWWVLTALVFLRAIAPWLPGSWLWGIDGLGDLPWWAWLLWLLTAVTLLPSFSRRFEPHLANTGRALERSAATRLLAAAAAALVVFLLADELRFVGDFLLRQGSAEQAVAPSRIYPQALPLDTFLHYTLPTGLLKSLGVDPRLTARILGAVYGATLALLAVAFVRRLETRGAALVAAGSVLWFGGWLLLFTGYAKAFAEMTLIIMASAILGLDGLRGKRSFFWFAILTAAALWLHRSALGLLPAAIYLAVEMTRVFGRAGRGKRAGREARWPVTAGWLAIAASLVLFAPRLRDSFALRDAAHFSLAESGRLLDLVSPLRLLDDFNLILFLVPLAPMALGIIRPPSEAAGIRPREIRFLLALAIPYWGLLVVLSPAQGLFRDFDTMAMSAMTIALAVAVGIAGVLKRQTAATGLPVAIVAGSAVPILLSLIAAADLDRGLIRIERWIAGPPERPAEIRAMTWDYLGVRNFRAGRYREATRGFARAAELAPSPRILLEWATAAEMARDRESARRAFTLLLERAPEHYQIRLTALVALARMARDDGDWETFARFTREALEIAPRNPVVQELARDLEKVSGAESPAPP